MRPYVVLVLCVFAACTPGGGRSEPAIQVEVVEGLQPLDCYESGANRTAEGVPYDLLIQESPETLYVRRKIIEGPYVHILEFWLLLPHSAMPMACVYANTSVHGGVSRWYAIRGRVLLSQKVRSTPGEKLSIDGLVIRLELEGSQGGEMSVIQESFCVGVGDRSRR